MRPIDADALCEALKFEKWYADTNQDRSIGRYLGLMRALENVHTAPTIEPVKHGRWEGKDDPMTWTCSNCGYHTFRYNNTPYCPNCGAKMDGKEA